MMLTNGQIYKSVDQYNVETMVPPDLIDQFHFSLIDKTC